MRMFVIALFSLLLVTSGAARAAPETFDYYQHYDRMDEHELFDEIDRLDGELDALTQAGTISPATQRALMALFSTMAASVAMTSAGTYWEAHSKESEVKFLDDLLKPALTQGVMPSVVISGYYVLFGRHDNPTSTQQNVMTGIRTWLTTISLWVTSVGLGHAANHFLGVKELGVNAISVALLPVHIYHLWMNYSYDQEEHDRDVDALRQKIATARSALHAKYVEDDA